ncbi:MULTISPECIES: helix-turn-helix domain-containing protein [Niastella]|uniref:Helix-turn-helix transcriptional regulator n=1 Tax=Niastella soli TaxID=2821487 RepID=A0ABS3Z359_9BACT|nr:AraC family transcriptional regulator [Niastella soli]MBO9204602.1 helix-turn-helix transcriptional regulator [Niastella soli]
MNPEKKFKRHVLMAVTAYKELLDAECSLGLPADQLSAQFGVSRNVLSMAFKKLFGESIRDYKLRKRMERGQELFDAGKDVKEVAKELKYTETRAFSTAYKRFFGLTPTTLNKLLQ